MDSSQPPTHGSSKNPKPARSPKSSPEGTPDAMEFRRPESAWSPLLDLLAELIARSVADEDRAPTQRSASPSLDPSSTPPSGALSTDPAGPGKTDPIPTFPADSHPHSRPIPTRGPRAARPRPVMEE